MNKTANKLALLITGVSIVNASSVSAVTTVKTIKLDNRNRSYKVHLPKNCKDEVMLPVVIILHGAGSNPTSIRLVTGMSKMAKKFKFIAVYPEGTGNSFGLLKTWNAGIQCGPAYKKAVNDISYISQVIDQVNRSYNTDPKRVYVAGMSNGGMMAYRLASELSDKVAAFGIVESSMFCDMPPHGKPVSLVAFHCKNDRVIPLDGGKGNWYGYRFESPSVQDSIKYWVKRNKCRENPEVTKSEGYTKYKYSGGTNGSEVVFYLLDEGGHSWPGAFSIPPFYNPSKKLSATKLMCEFFMSRKSNQ